MFFIYNTLLCTITPLLVLYFILKKRSYENITSLSWRLGRYPADFLPPPEAQLRIWLHASSVGEINAVIPYIKSLRHQYPNAWLVVSTMTGSGLQFAREHLPEVDKHFLAPFDLFFAAKRAIRRIQSSLFITAETEIWPNLLRYARRSGARILMINGRVSPRSIGFYRKIRSFLHQVLGYYDLFSVILPEDAARLIEMGADPLKIRINGNIKYDRLAQQINPVFYEESKQLLHLTGDEQILLAGSTREGEEELLLQAFLEIRKIFPDLRLIIAPRHIQRAQEVTKIIREFNFNPRLRTEITGNTVLTPNDIIVIDTLGELSKLYSIATIAFCGASLVPLGGQNPLEPAAWGKVVLYGPSMDDFLDAKSLLEQAGAGFAVNNPGELATKVQELLQQPEALARRGVAAKQAVLAQQGSSRRNLELTINLLKEK